MAKIVILGAGLTGISAAYHLEQNNFYDYKMFEKENEIGGLCRSVYQDGFTFDYTGHLLHINDNYFSTLIDNLVGKENFNSINRRSFIYSKDVYTHYPFQINLFGLPQNVITECLEGFKARPQTSTEPKTFYQWVLKNFGRGFGKHFFFTYQNKIFAYDIKKISSSWTGRFVPQTSLEQIIQGSEKEPDLQNVGYNSQFYYPKKDGIIYWVQKIADKIKNPVYKNHCVKSINLKNKIVTFTNGHCESYEKLITTIPLDLLLNLIEDTSCTSLKQAANKLVCNSVVNFNLGTNKENLSDKHWIYFPENQYPFYRIGFPHNFSTNVTPAGCSSLYGEFAYTKNSKINIEETLKYAIASTQKLLKISESDILVKKIIHIDRAYVIYNFWREENLAKLHEKLNENDIYSIGRYGEWKYSSMQEAVLDGKKTIENLLI
ncbi:MAG: FAD-dependent oxidoreductase [Candidatus Babeliales bacterium]|nr:FAD-dependent oxidoreductase [Candidatus Babeliales bacterium]